MANIEDDTRCKELTRPIQKSEKMSGNYATAAAGAAFFKKKPTAATIKMVPVQPLLPLKEPQQLLTPNELCSAVIKRVEDSNFCEKHKAKGAPLAMLALAEELVDKVIRPKDTMKYFNGITLTVPNYEDAYNNPHYHSIFGQKLLLVDWERVYGIKVTCPSAMCSGVLKNTRTNFSKNKTLFPIYGIEGPPAWCIVQSMACSCCRRQFSANDGDTLVNLPPHITNEYHVNTAYASANATCHISRNAAKVFASIMVTYGNGELCSKLLYDAINRSYIKRIEVYYSYATLMRKEGATKEYLPKDGTFIKQSPPLGDTIRDLYNAAALSTNNRWGISDFERHTREIQGVKLDGGIFAQDHTFEPIKNYMKSVGAKAAWDAASQTGEIASVVLVRSTKTEDFAQAAQQLLNRLHFKPKVMYSDTWPNKKEFWNKKGIDGKLGLFHYQKRIISTLKKTHIDYFDAITDLLAALYAYCPEDYEKLLAALKDGSLSKSNRKYSSSEITAMKGTKMFRDQYAKYLRKQMHENQTIIQMLDDWFCKCKVTSSDPENKPAHGRLDPVRMIPLFTAETKTAVECCKEKACFLTDPMPLKDMYQEILPNPNASHQLTEYLSLRGESKLEAFHDRFAHFANCGMRESLADNLNLAGTARYNLSIRHVRALVSTNNENPHDRLKDRRKIPAAWEKVVAFFNHSELWHINQMATSLGCSSPFPKAEVLVPDNGERFFSQYLTKTLPSVQPQKYGEDGECLCTLCTETTTTNTSTNTTTSPPMEPNEQNAGNKYNNNNNTPASTTTTTPTVERHRGKIVNKASRQTQCAVAKSNWPASLVNQHHQPTPIFPHPQYQQFIPMPYQLPFYIPPPACCTKYAEWLQRRVGRPPHHHFCPF